MTMENVKAFIADNSRFLLTSHVNPDGDGIGSAMALKHALLKLGKQAEIIIDGKPPKIYDFLSEYQWVQDASALVSGMGKFKSVIACDAPNIARLGKVAKFMDGGVKVLNLDHHISNEDFGDINHVILDAASSTQVVADIIKELGVELTTDMAEAIYVGLVFDTGRFKFSNTTPEALVLASELVTAGVSPDRVSEKIYSNKTFETIQALGVFLDSIELHFDGKVSTAQLELDYVTSDAWQMIDTEGFVNYALAIQGVEVACSFREVEPDITRGSLRAKHDFDVNALASVWGGGGHQKAAGCTINMKLDAAKKAVLEEVSKRI